MLIMYPVALPSSNLDILHTDEETCDFLLFFFIKTLFSKNRFRFTAKFKGRYRALAGLAQRLEHRPAD